MAVVAGLIAIDDAVAATGRSAVGAAGVRHDVAVGLTVAAGLAGADEAVAARATLGPIATGRAIRESLAHDSTKLLMAATMTPTIETPAMMPEDNGTIRSFPDCGARFIHAAAMTAPMNIASGY